MMGGPAWRLGRLGGAKCWLLLGRDMTPALRNWGEFDISPSISPCPRKVNVTS